jgi:hypothetical protein
MFKIYKKEMYVFGAIFLLFLMIYIIFPAIAFAEENLVFLTEGGVPGISSNSNFNDFLNASFKIGLAVAATLAVVMITVGGFEYMGSESVFSKTAGRERIQNAIIGLLIALLIWIILYTINPNLLNFNINIEKPTTNQNASNILGNDINNASKGGASLEAGTGASKRATSIREAGDEAYNKAKEDGKTDAEALKALQKAQEEWSRNN